MIPVGTPLRGFCGGAFGRDFPHAARVEAVGFDWLVARDERGGLWFAAGSYEMDLVREQIEHPADEP